MPDRLRRHWPEYLMEAAGLGLFMIVAAACASVLEYPASPLRQFLPDPLVRRALMGVAMGATSIALVYSPLGARSGAHLNPATTLTFFRLGRVHGDRRRRLHRCSVRRRSGRNRDRVAPRSRPGSRRRRFTTWRQCPGPGDHSPRSPPRSPSRSC